MTEAFEITLPSGAIFPDWSGVTSPVARATLNAIFDIERVERRWAGLDGDGDRLRRAVLKAYLRSGCAPSLNELGAATGLDADSLRERLADLARRDIVVANGDGDGGDDAGEADNVIAGAYPFVEHSRGHRLRINGVGINAMCAIDALGAGAMCGEDVVIDSACAHCGDAIHLETRDRGEGLAVVTPAGAVVRVGIEHADNCAASSLCRMMSYFCSDDHLDAWCAANRAQGEGYRLAMIEALQVGKAIFAPLLKEARP